MIAITYPIKQMINSKYGFLFSMLDRFPSLLSEWIKKQKEEVEQLEREYAEGDKVIISTIKGQELHKARCSEHGVYEQGNYGWNLNIFVLDKK